MPISEYPNGFRNGLSVRGMPILNNYAGDVYWVDSGSGSDDNQGTFNSPFKTMDYANGQATANNGDFIMVKPGHTETVSAAAGLDLDTAGVTWIGLGGGSARPQINFTSATGADMDVDAANINMVNFLFTGGVDALTGPIDVNAADFSLINCETRDVTGQTVDFIVCDANADRLYIENWIHRGAAAAGAQSALQLVGGDDAIVKDFQIYGNFGTAAIENVTTASVRTKIYGDKQCFIWTENAADIAITMVATASGDIGPYINIRLQDDAANITEAVAPGNCQVFQPVRLVNADGESSLETTITASKDQ